MSALLDRLGTYVRQNDPISDPSYADAAGLLADAASEAQRHGQVVQQLSVRADELLDPRPEPVVARHFDTQADWCEDILKRSEGPRRYADIGDQMYAEGYAHSVRVKNPDRQLKDSIWVAMNEDNRFVRVGRGKFDLAARHPVP